MILRLSQQSSVEKPTFLSLQGMFPTSERLKRWAAYAGDCGGKLLPANPSSIQAALVTTTMMHASTCKVSGATWGKIIKSYRLAVYFRAKHFRVFFIPV